MTGFVVARMRAHRLLLASALLSVLLATCVGTTLAAFATAVGDAGPRRALEHRAAPRTVLDVRSDVTAEDRKATDAAVRQAARDAFGGLPVRTAASTHSGAYALPSSLRPGGTGDLAAGAPGASGASGASQDDEPALTRFATFDRARVTMVDGSWPRAPRAGERTVGAAVPQRAAERLSLRPGDTFRVTSRLDGPPDVRVEVTGVYAPASPGSAYWKWLDPLAGRGMAVGDFTTYGPLAVPDGAFAGGEGRTAETRGAEKARGAGMALWPAETRWQADADFTGLDTSRLDALGDDVARAADRIGASPLTPHAVATTDLPELLDSLTRSLLVMRSTLLIAALPLVLLTGLTLLLVAQLLHTERASQTALLRARGASRTRVCTLAAAEALLLALPAAVAAPLLAGPAVRWQAAHGALARAGVEPAAGVPGGWWVAAATALGCALLIALPTLLARGRAGDEDPESDATRGGGPRTPARRRRTAATLLRGGADLALVVLAAVAYWQLERRAGGTGVLSARADSGARGGSGGALGIDPVLVAAPALALLAGTVLVLRVLPLAARLGERFATRGRGLAAALAGWQLSRRPLRGAGPALLLVLAVATGVFAVGQGASWDRSQDDQADFRTGADIFVSGSSAPPLAQGGLFTGLRGVEGVAPVARASFSTAGDRTAQLLATDASTAGDGILRLRDDLADEAPSRLLRPLPGQDRTETGVRLPEDTRGLRLRVRLEGERASPDDERGSSGTEQGSPDKGGKGEKNAAADTDAGSFAADTLSLTVEDRFGVPYRLPLGDVPGDGEAHTLSAALAQGGGTPAGPVRLTGIGVSYPAPAHSRQRELTVEEIAATGSHGSRTVRPARQEQWTPRVRADDAQASLGRGPYADADARKAALRPDGAALTARYTTGSAPPEAPRETDPVTVSVLWSPGAPPGGAHRPIAAVATDAYLRASGAEVGDTVTVDALGTELSVRLTGAVRALPTVSPAPATEGESSAGALLFDLGTLNRTLAGRDATLLEPRTWWLSVAGGAGDRVAGKLRAEPAVGAVRVRDEVAAELRGDPLGAGPRSALTALAAAAAVLAATGFAVSAAGAARERADEFAVLRALGAPRRRLAHALAAEQGLVLVLSAALGLGLGALLVRLVVPLIVVTGDARAPVPDLLVRLPAGGTAALLAAVLAVPLAVVAATAFRRAGPVAAPRTERGD
ncbi:FtsX-like permease family protein [Streptomyces reniochalinae]|uniref:ABC transporter permease n=1 Tax=Streptomyces reniochalinae TaxID=2250578 RepID=A0A367E9H4_9ACTN|nr:FtsX-like permease family protein [Streptomyces reniochalinae]RCG14633.1 ABC transporter permease [Streptomyces reniochalinae]